MTAAGEDRASGARRWVLEGVALAAALTAIGALTADGLPRYAAFAVATVGLGALAAAVLERGLRRALPVGVALVSTACFLRAVARPVTDAASGGFTAPGVVRADGAAAAGMEWVGEPFAGAPGATAAFLALAIPLVLPGALGGATAAVRVLVAPGAPRISGLAAAALAVAPTLVLLHGVNELLLGAGVLRGAGAVAVILACLAAAAAGRSPGSNPAGMQLAALIGGAAGLALGAAGVATPASADAAWIGLVALGIGGAALAGAAPGLQRAAARAHVVPMARAQPTTFLLFGLVAVALAGLPPLLPYVARARAFGAVAEDGGGREALLLMFLQAPLLAVAALPLIAGLFLRTAGGGGDAGPGRDAPLRAIPLGVAAAALVALGVEPSLLEAMAPEGGAASAALPGPLAQLELLGGGAVVALLLAPVVARRARTR